MDKIIYGADTETHEGEPMTLQFYSEDIACDEIHYVGPGNAAKTFIKWCKSRKRNIAHVLYIHNLGFDLIELLWGHHPKLVTSGGEFEFKIEGLFFTGVYGTPTFCRITNGHDLSITLVDSFSFFRGSLAKAATLFCPDLPKLKRPDGLGSKLFKKGNAIFEAYAMRDAEVTYHMGRAIEAMHRQFDIKQCVSVADMAAKIFRKRLTYTIHQPSRDVIDAALLSYHGGKNNITRPRGWYTGVQSLDISSAYPHAMMQLPAFSNPKLYRRIKANARAKVLPEFGVYQVSGKVAPCEWPVLFSHGFKPLSGEVDRVWVQGFELNEAISSGEFKPTAISGYFYDAERDYQAPAFRGFIEEFYNLKETATDKVFRTLYKLIMNSISGKFVQTRKRGAIMMTDIDAGETVSAADLVAGGLFHPFIASAITAHTRARIHQLEHKFKAIHTATDGIMTQAKSARAVGRGIGSLTVEARDATLLLIRNKCYALYGAKSDKTSPSYGFKGKHLIKYALHGFQGTITDLEKLVSTGRRAYTVNKPNTLKDSLKRGLVPNKFETRSYTLKVGDLKVNP